MYIHMYVPPCVCHVAVEVRQRHQASDSPRTGVIDGSVSGRHSAPSESMGSCNRVTDLQRQWGSRACLEGEAGGAGPG